MRISDWSSDVCSSDLVVGAAVDDEHRPVRDLRRVGDGSQLAELAGPGIEVGWEVAVLDQADLAGVLQQPSGVGGPVVEVGRCAQSGDTADRRVERRGAHGERAAGRSEEHTSELQSLMRISYAVF